LLGKRTSKTAVPLQDSDSETQSFEENITLHCKALLELCTFALKAKHKKEFPCKDFLRHFHMEATTMEELIDNYGAQKNEIWFPFREAVAAEKLFSQVYYNLIHIEEALPRYRLLDIEDDFQNDVAKVFKVLKKGLLSTSETMIQQAKRCNVFSPEIAGTFKRCYDETIPYRLPANRSGRHSQRIGKSIVYLATQFLNLTEDGDVYDVLRERDDCDFEACVPEMVNESKIRIVESRFHNLQSLYDTYIFESDLEIRNRNLSVLRGHISAIYHLFEVATDLVHYYERHMSSLRRTSREDLKFPVTEEELLSILFDFLLHYARHYMESATHLCRAMIQEYSEKSEINVPIPNYRGFHVRPSTLIAKIVAHYGSTVEMELNDQKYDAGVTFELFRANEEINALKRRKIADLLSSRPELQDKVPQTAEERMKELQMLFIRLMKINEIIFYDTDLPAEELAPQQGETLADLAGRYIKQLMALSKIDVKCDVSVTFRGDSRALSDIKLLAENGYGEDKFGNNIVLPPELAFLRR
jgi:hypothetical protein